MKTKLFVTLAASLFIVSTGSVIAAPNPQIPEQAKVLHARLAAKLSPAARAWVAGEAHRISKDQNASKSTVRADVQSHFASQSATARDIEALVFIVMMQATNDMDQDLKSIMAEVKAETVAKQRQRDLIAKANTDAAHYGSHPTPSQGAASKYVFRKTTPAGTSSYPANETSTEGRLDSRNEMSEMTSLRLQMTMDRRSKFVDTLSNIMKEVSDTDGSIIQNLK